MTVAASIILAAIVGGIIFVLLDSWQRRGAAAPVAAPPEPEPRQEPLPSWDLPPRREEPEPPGSLWSGWGRR